MFLLFSNPKMEKEFFIFCTRLKHEYAHEMNSNPMKDKKRKQKDK